MDIVSFKNSNYFISIKDGKEILQHNIRKFGRINNIDSRRICDILNKKRITPIKGYTFRYPTEKEFQLIELGMLNIDDNVD